MRMKKFLILFLVGIFLLSPLVGLAQFKLQQTYPNIGGTDLGTKLDANGKPISVGASQSIPTLVKYLLNLTVWICILAAVLTLIIGGIQYVASVGDVGKMSGAKTRIYGALLGLAILIGSWFVLYTVNPSFVLPKISYTPIKQGIVFFTKDGYCQFMGNRGIGCPAGVYDVDPSIINDLIQSNQAKFINYSNPDLTTGFGPLIFSGCGPASDTSAGGRIEGTADSSIPKVIINKLSFGNLDFADFQPHTFAFWGKKAQGAKLIFYNQPEYAQVDEVSTNTALKPQVYDYRGLLDVDGNVITTIFCTEKNDKIKDAIVISPDCFANSGDKFVSPYKYKFITQTSAHYLNAARYFNRTSGKEVNDKLAIGEKVFFNQCNELSGGKHFDLIDDPTFRSSAIAPAPMAINHPPLSVKITWTTPGAYLVDTTGDERYFDTSAPDFKNPSVNFDQKAVSVKIINDTPERIYVDESGAHTTPPEYQDFLAILHQQDNFSNRLKVYFEQRMYKIKGSIKSSKTSEKALIPAYNICGSPVLESFLDPTKKLSDAKVSSHDIPPSNPTVESQIFKVDPGRYLFWIDYNFGHLPMVSFDGNGKVLLVGGSKSLNSENITTPLNADEVTYGVKEESRYGKLVSSPASIEVFELSQNPGASGECQEVKICTEKGGLGDCLAYTSENNKANEPNIVYYPMPWYLRVPLPNEANTCPSAWLPSFKKPDGSSRPRVFENNIKSIVIKPEGKCAVVLMANDDEARNSVFTNSDYNLDDNEIGQCGSLARFGGWLSWNCAKTIAVYPIK